MGAALGAWPFVYLAVSTFAGRFLDRYGIQVGLTLSGVDWGIGIIASRCPVWSGIVAGGGNLGLEDRLFQLGPQSWYGIVSSEERDLP